MTRTRAFGALQLAKKNRQRAKRDSAGNQLNAYGNPTYEERVWEG